MTDQPSPRFEQLEMVWAASDYAPTAEKLAPASSLLAARLCQDLPPASDVVDIGAGYGGLSSTLAAAGHRVTAIEPVERIAEFGRRRAPNITWIAATGEQTTLPKASCDAIVSSFASMLCEPGAGVAEWARILRPGGRLLMTTWNDHGVLAEMTRLMAGVLQPGPYTTPPHLMWGSLEHAQRWLEPSFEQVDVERFDLDWSFDSVDDGMQLYLEGSPVHAFALQMAGEKRAELERVLREHLAAHVDATGRVAATASYSLVSARKAGELDA